MTRQAAVAGSWYPADPRALHDAVTRVLARVSHGAQPGVVGLLAPHAGFVYSGEVAARAYGAAAAADGVPDAIVLVGPSHHVAFEGVAAWRDGAFETPLGPVEVATDLVDRLIARCPSVVEDRAPHVPEHSLEMHLPFIRHLFPGVPIVPLLMGAQTFATMGALAEGLSRTLSGRPVLLAASSDLSHYFDAATAEALDARVLEAIDDADAAPLRTLLAECPVEDRGRSVGCGAGPLVSVIEACRFLGADDGQVLAYSHSGRVSGDNHAVVGYAAALFTRRVAPAVGT